MQEEQEYQDPSLLITKEWSEYVCYDKKEYDVRLKDGSEHFGLYPNAGKFASTKGYQIPEEDVTHIRLTHFPEFYINDGDVCPDDNPWKIVVVSDDVDTVATDTRVERRKFFEIDGPYFNENPHSYRLPKELKDLPVLEVKPRDKQGRNELCKCGSNKKVKHCCNNK